MVTSYASLSIVFQVVDTWFPLAVRQAILCATGLLILLTRWQVMGSQTPVFQIVDNPHSFVNSTVFRVRSRTNIKCIALCKLMADIVISIQNEHIVEITQKGVE